MKWKGEEESLNGIFFKDVNNDLTPKMIRGIEERVRNSFVIKHSYAYQLRNIETEETMAYFQNKRSPWFERISEAGQWLEEQEKNRLQNENIERQDKKWVFEANLMVNIKEIKGDFMVDSLHLPLFPLIKM